MNDRTEAQRRRAEIGAAIMTLMEKTRRENGEEEDPQLTLAASMVIGELWHQFANVDRIAASLENLVFVGQHAVKNLEKVVKNLGHITADGDRIADALEAKDP